MLGKLVKKKGKHVELENQSKNKLSSSKLRGCVISWKI